MKIEEIIDKTDAEIISEINNRKEELFRLRLRKVTDVLENPSLVRNIRKDIARLKTILRSRQLLNQGKKVKDGEKESQKEASPQTGTTPKT
jgi:large subunit ribosomal protein L29